MIESLEDLNNELNKYSSKLYITYGLPHESLASILNSLPTIKNVYLHNDVTPFSIERDKLIKQVCDSAQVEYKSYWDDVLAIPCSVKSNNDTY